ncbi:MAG: permease-like cell division protein FtsX [Bacteroidota bacterium]
MKPAGREFSYLKRRSRSTFMTSMLSMALVLFFLGIFATVVLFANTFSQIARESIVMKVFLHDGVGTDQLQRFTAYLGQQPYVQDYEYISKDAAGKLLLERTGEDVLEIMDGVNPLLASVNVGLKASYIHMDSLNRITRGLSSRPVVADIEYPVEMITAISQNVQTLTVISLIVGVLVAVIAFYLIFGTIKLAIFAQRLIIRSMQLIGATYGFIRRPFLLRGLLQGSLAAVLACACLVGLLVFINGQYELIDVRKDVFFQTYFIGILGGIVLLGSLLGLTGSYFAVSKYLGKSLDQII